MGQLDRIRSYSSVGSIVSIYAIASLIVVLIGPSLGFGFLEQIIIIAILLVTWPFVLLIGHFRRRRQERKEARQAAANGSSGELSRRPSRTPSRVYDELNRSAEEVVQWLRQTRLGSEQRGDPAYALPWFLVAGAPGAGKTSLLLSGGLDFHALPSQRRSDRNLIRPTRDVEWRVTDWCVFLDSAGRYQTEGLDGDEWTALAEVLKKHRKRRPIDGLIVVADAEKLLRAAESEIEQQAKVLRGKIDSIKSLFETRFPVYLVFSRADSIEGFDDFFRLADGNERRQVWGATIQLQQSASAHALFDVEFDYLYDTLMRYRLQRLASQESAEQQLMVFDFPLRFAEARRRLGLFTSALFRPSPFSESPLMRGFYFTNSLAGGLPGAGQQPAAAGDQLEEIAVAGDGCFSHRFFDDVLRRDKDLAASFQRGQRNPYRLRNVLGVAAAVLALFFIAAQVISFINNTGLIRETRRVATRVAAQSKSLQGADQNADRSSVRLQLEDIDRLRGLLARLDEFDNDWPPFYFSSLFYRVGLYSGSDIAPYARAIYFEAIDQRFLKQTVERLEADLQSFNPASGSTGSPPPGETGAAASAPADDPEAAEDRLGQYYDLLKVYLMLSRRPDRAEPSLLSDRLAEYWKKEAAPGEEAIALRQLDFYAASLTGDDVPRIKANDEAINLACVRLESYPPVNRYYKRVVDEISRTTKEVTLDEIVAGKKGIVEGSTRVRGAFTIEGYKKMLEAIDDADSGISQEDWVCPNTPKGKDQTADTSKLKTQYARQYIDAWRKFLNGVSVAEYNSPEAALDALKELAKNDSPVARVLSEVVKQTNISKPRSFWAKINPFSAARSKTGAAIAAQIENDFQTVIRFVSGESGGGDQMTQYLKTLTEVRDILNDASVDGWQQAAKRLLSNNDPNSLTRFESQQMKPLIEQVKSKSGAGKDAGTLLEQPLGNLRKLLLASNVDQMDREWRERLQLAAQRLEQAYPFTPSNADAPLTDFARMFNPVDGQFWVFFRQNLESYFEEDSGGRWKLREGSKLRPSDGFVAYINNARRLTEALFAQNSKTPGFDFSVTLQGSQGAYTTAEMQVEGRRIEAGAPSQNIKWSGSSGVVIEISQGIGQRKAKRFDGSWALFRALESGGGTRTADNQYSLSLAVEGAAVRARLQPSSAANNPFDLRLFRELRAPQSVQ